MAQYSDNKLNNSNMVKKKTEPYDKQSQNYEAGLALGYNIKYQSESLSQMILTGDFYESV